MDSVDVTPVQIVGRYALGPEIASGGMATVHLGRLLGPVGFSRTVAIKRLHPQYARDPEFVAMFLDEARLTAHVRHPSVVATLDVVAQAGELFLVLDYVQGESFGRLLAFARDRGERIPAALVSGVVAGALAGLHAAHQAADERRRPLHIVHRDVSPQNILVGIDGLPRVADFGIAKATRRIQTTRHGQLKGKLGYMAPEQLRGEASPKSDVYSAAVVLWEALTGKRLFEGDDGEVITAVLAGDVEPPGRIAPDLPVALDAVVLRGLERDPERRFATARDMAEALERAVAPATAGKIGAWVEDLASPKLAERSADLAAVETYARSIDLPDPTPIDTSIDGPTVAIPGRAIRQPKVLVPPSQRRRKTGGLGSRRWLALAAVAGVVGSIAGVVAARLSSERGTAAAASAPPPASAEPRPDPAGTTHAHTVGSAVAPTTAPATASAPPDAAPPPAEPPSTNPRTPHKAPPPPRVLDHSD
jgi:eukaryotic-like serine/threonine-protein kinase